MHGVVQLTHTWRFGGAIDALARAIRAADADAAVAVLRSGANDVQFNEIDLESAPTGVLGAGVRWHGCTGSRGGC